MKKTGKTVLSYFSGFSFLSVVFWWAIYYLGGLSYLYYNKEVVKHIFVFFTVVILILAKSAIIRLYITAQIRIVSACTVYHNAFDRNLPACLVASVLGQYQLMQFHLYHSPLFYKFINLLICCRKHIYEFTLLII